MIIPAISLPQIKALYKALFADYSIGKSWISCGSGQSLSFYSRGMWAMAEGIKVLLKEAGKTQGYIWLPDYICNEPLQPLRYSSFKFIFYPVEKDFRPKWEILERFAKSTACPGVFVLVHYFGFPNDIDGAKVFCEKYQVKLFEDAAHVLLPMGSIGQDSSAIMFSPRKLLAIPECGLLVMPEKFAHSLVAGKNNGDGKVVIKWLMRRLAQKIMLTLRVPWHRFRKIIDVFASTKIDNMASINCNSRCNTYTRKLLSVVERDLNQVVTKRRENYNLLCQSLKDVDEISLLFPMLPNDVCPYAFPLIIKECRDLIIKQLQSIGIPAGSWPDLPPEVLRDETEHSIANWMQKNIILLPVHQGLSQKQVEYMANSLKRLLKKGYR